MREMCGILYTEMGCAAYCTTIMGRIFYLNYYIRVIDRSSLYEVLHPNHGQDFFI
jgi:hypothetical protein